MLRYQSAFSPKRRAPRSPWWPGFASEGRLNRRYHRFLGRAFELRQLADYAAEVDVDSAVVSELIKVGDYGYVYVVEGLLLSEGLRYSRHGQVVAQYGRHRGGVPPTPSHGAGRSGALGGRAQETGGRAAGPAGQGGRGRSATEARVSRLQSASTSASGGSLVLGGRSVFHAAPP